MGIGHIFPYRRTPGRSPSPKFDLVDISRATVSAAKE